MAKRSNSLTKFLQDVVDDTKDLVDDLIDRAKDVEDNARDAIRDVVDDDDDKVTTNGTATGKELSEIRLAISNLTAQVNQLAKQPVKQPA